MSSRESEVFSCSLSRLSLVLTSDHVQQVLKLCVPNMLMRALQKIGDFYHCSIVPTADVLFRAGST